MAKRSPLPIDVLVGQNIRICRLQKELSQGELGRRIGVTFQQVQKYEKGANRVGASRLTQIADVLGVPIPTLFDGAPTAAQTSTEPTARFLLAKPHSLRLLQGFDKIDNDATRLAVLHLVESLIQNSGPRRVRQARSRPPQARLAHLRDQARGAPSAARRRDSNRFPLPRSGNRFLS